MPTPVTLDAITRHLLEAFARVWRARLGGTAAMAPSSDAQGPGWIASVPVSGAAAGRIIVWVDRTAAAACAKLASSLDRDAEEAEVIAFLREIVVDATTSLGAAPEVAGVTFGEPVLRAGEAPAGLPVSYPAIANVASCLVGVGVDAETSAASAGSRLDAVLDVDLPLVVRFGRAVMPLRALAELGPGSVVDMGRSPDEPVELLVGER